MFNDLKVIVLVPVFLLFFVFFEELGPLFFVSLAGLLTDVQLWEYLNHGNETGQHNKVDEANLTLGDICDDSIVEWVNLELMDLLEIALSEKFDEKEVTPQAA